MAQIADVVYGRLVPLSPMQKRATEATIPLEVTPDVIHEEGTLSIGRHADPNSGGSSFSILYGRQQHLDMQYTIFGCACNPYPPTLVGIKDTSIAPYYYLIFLYKIFSCYLAALDKEATSHCVSEGPTQNILPEA